MERGAALRRKGIITRLARCIWIEGARTRSVHSLPLRGLNGTEETVLLVIHAGSEEEHVGGASLVIIAKCQRPECRDRDGIAVAVRERAEEDATPQVEGVDAAIAGVADEQGTTERTETRGRQGELRTPWDAKRRTSVPPVS
jgi:hypothetical protein